MTINLAHRQAAFRSGNFEIDRSCSQWKGLIGWWPLVTSGAITPNMIGRNNWGEVITGAPNDINMASRSHPRFGTLRSYLFADAPAEYVSPGVLDISTFSSISYSLWFLTSANTQRGFSINHSGSDDIRLFTTSGGEMQLGVDDGTAHVVTTSASFNDSLWHHAVMSFDGGTVEAYVDGVNVGTVGSASFNFSTASGTFRIGGVDGDGQWDGQIVDVRLFNRAVSPDEAKDIYENPLDLVLPPIHTRVFSFPEQDDTPVVHTPYDTMLHAF